MHAPAIYATLAIAFAAGIALFAGGTWMVARSRASPGAPVAAPAWTQALGLPRDETVDVATRLDMVERLALVGQPWCVEILHAAGEQERDPQMRAAIAAALRVPLQPT